MQDDRCRALDSHTWQLSLCDTYNNEKVARDPSEFVRDLLSRLARCVGWNFCLQPGVAISALFTGYASVTELNSPIEICSVIVALSFTELYRSQQHVIGRVERVSSYTRCIITYCLKSRMLCIVISRIYWDCGLATTLSCNHRVWRDNATLRLGSKELAFTRISISAGQALCRTADIWRIFSGASVRRELAVHSRSSQGALPFLHASIRAI